MERMIFDFGQIAERYDDFYGNPVGRMVDRFEKAAVDRVLPRGKPGEKLLEAGSGTGHWSAHFASRGYEVTGVEISPEMVEVARRKQIPGARFLVGDASRTGFPDDAFDIGAGITVLEFVDDPGALVAEIARVVKSGGRLVFGVLHEDSFLGRRRVRDPDPVYSKARFFTVPELDGLLRPHGEVAIKQCLFVPPVQGALKVAEKIEAMGLSEGWTKGNFLVAEVWRQD
jgi:ubiquinone/menaquinone biosynthesis C-methylase UbiE